MNKVVRKIVRVADLPEHLRAGLDPSRPVEIVQEVLTASQRVRAMTDALTFRRVQSTEEAVERVRRIRDGGPI
jgi:hypothetical protein